MNSSNRRGDLQRLAERATLVRTAEGLSTDARTLAAQIGLAKAMRKYDLRKLITFHSSVAKAARFVDATRRDSLPGMIPHLTRSARPSGKLWTKHISGHTPAGQRATLLKGLGHLPEDTRGILSNCACLGEGVDVPVLDGVAFIDPKRSMVDIIQAVGRVIRKAAGKQLGTIVIPVFIDDAENADVPTLYGLPWNLISIPVGGHARWIVQRHCRPKAVVSGPRR